MKTIFIATDFSEAARNAGRYGVELAKAFNARVILFNAWYPVAAVAVEGTLVLSWQEYCSFAKEQLNNEIDIINPRREVTIDAAFEEGTPTETILRAALANKADLVIVGMKGSGKTVRKLFGSTATDLAAKTTLPVIIVPEDARFAMPSAIALASEDDLAPGSDPHLLNTLRDVVERFHSRLYLVRVVRNEFHEVYEIKNKPLHLQKIIRTLDPQYELIQGKDIAHTLNNFIESHSVNLLALLPHKYTAWDKLFYKSTTRSMAFATHIPLLLLPGLFDIKDAHRQEQELNTGI